MTTHPIRQKAVKANGYTFDCRISGKPEDDAIIFLHGWPETSHMWQELMGLLADQNYYCVAPNMRGFSIGAKPKDKSKYHVNELAKDIIGIADALAISKFHLVGHDWGAGIGWHLISAFPEPVQSWTGLSVPHLQAFGKAIVEDPQQAKMSAYMKGFQLPYLPELRLKQQNFKVLRKLWRESNPEQLEDYLSVFRKKGVLRTSLNYYRKNYKLLINAASRRILGDIFCPTLFFWGTKDFAIGRKSIEWQAQYMKGYYKLVELEGAGHWLVQTRLVDIKEELLEHLNRFPINK